ncbi:Protein ZPS1 [Pseudozyma hubeiensis]|nr:Protein ZPS1 [Pseudozyma hubeiensis]
MQLLPSFLTLSAMATLAVAYPSSLYPRSLASFQPEESTTSQWKIHESCNGTQRAQISRGIDDMHKLATNSLNHILNYPKDEYFTKYFGANADPAPVIGYFAQLVYGNKGDALLRCDNPDDNCRLPEWNGHWRGNNATSETVICELSYTSRLPLEKLCSGGFQLSVDNPSTYFGADLMHRAFHVPEFSHEKIHHYADSYADVLELAKSEGGNGTKAVENQHSLQYFSLDIYSRKLTRWGCVGEVEEDHDDHDHDATTSSAAAATTQTQTAQASASTASATAADCHTHADGSIHCGTH